MPRVRKVPGMGPREAKIALVGEQPGKTEIIQGKPFKGPAGQVLDECLQTAKIPRSSCYITNVIKDLNAPLKAYIDIPSNSRTRVRLYPAGEKYLEELKDELTYVSPNVVVALGNVALYALTERRGITKWRGSILESTLIPGMKVIPTFHPSTVLPKPPQHMGIYLNKHLIVHDLMRASEESLTPDISLPSPTIHTRPSFEECISWLIHLNTLGERTGILDFDIEVVNEELFCCSFSPSPLEAYVIPFMEAGHYWTMEQEREVMRLIAKILENPHIAIRGQFIEFDIAFMLLKYGIKTAGPIHSTSVAQRLTLTDYPIGLDFITSVHTRYPYYKADGKKYLRAGGDLETFWRYNGMDTITTATAHPAQMKNIHSLQNLPTYERHCKLIPPLVYMQVHGIKVDVQGILAEREVVKQRIKELEQELWSLVGYELNYNSPKQMAKYFYDEKGIPPYTKRNSRGGRSITCDADALKRIARGTKTRPGLPEARLVMQLRTLSNKTLSTYLSLDKIDPDGRYRSQYNPVGARTGRLSSMENIFGTGGNQQNWPHELQRFLIADPGYVIYSVDLSQAENRIVAYVGRVIEMIQAFESGTDVHALTASMIFGKPISQVSSEDGSSELGDGKHSERYWGKKANHCKFRDCEVLTPDGWKGIAEACYDGSEIAQWDPSGEISFTKPSSWYKAPYSGKRIILHNKRFFQSATPEHRMPLFYEDGRLLTKRISEYPASGKYKAPLSGQYSGGRVSLDPHLMRLLVAFQADGCWNGNSIVIRVYKPRKVARLKQLLRNANVPYNDTPSGIRISAKSTCAKLFMLLLGKEKLFGKWLLDLSPHTLEVFLDELPHWDGSANSKEYFTTSRQNAEWAQTIAHLCGKAASLHAQHNELTSSYGSRPVYRVKIHTQTAPATHAIARHTIDVIDETIYCPTVPTGFFLCREGGKISVTGNSLNYDIGVKEFALKCELPEYQAKFLIERYHRAYPGVRENYHAMIKNQLMADRTLTNLFGRRRKFLEKWGRDLFKDAYAHIPQSTVADKINEHGLLPLYYWEEFRPVELLRQVHDDIGFQLPLSLGWEAHAKILLKLRELLEQPLTWHDRQFVIPADITMGLSFGKSSDYCQEWKSHKVPNDVEQFAKMLREAYHELEGNAKRNS